MPSRTASVLLDRLEPAWSHSAVQGVRRLTQLRCWVVPGRDSSSSASSGRRVTSLHSSVRLRRVYTCLLFLHTSAGKNPAGSVPGRQEAAVPAAGADIVSLVHSCAVPQTAKDCAGAAVPGLRPGVLYLRSGNGPSRPRPRRPSVCPSRRSLPLLQGALRLPSATLQSPPPPTSSRPPPGPRSTRFARSAPYGTGRLTDAAQSHLHNPRVCETASTIGQPGAHARASVRYRPYYPARTEGKDEYTYTGKQRLPPLRGMSMPGVSFEVLGSYCFA